MKTYDAILIFPSSLKEDAVAKNTEKVTGEITKLGGAVLETRQEGLRTFAHPLNKKEAGYYLNLRFEMDPANVNALRARLRLNEEIFRVQVTNAAARGGTQAANKTASQQSA